jgi:hypothetical protein
LIPSEAPSFRALASFSSLLLVAITRAPRLWIGLVD